MDDKAMGDGFNKLPPLKDDKAPTDAMASVGDATDMREVPTGPEFGEVKSSGKYRLRVDHELEGRLLPAGTEVGTDTGIPWPGYPTNQMEGLDDAGKRAVNEYHQRLYGADAPWHDPNIGRRLETEQAVAENQRQQEKDSAPVSHQQAWEQGKEWKGAPHPYIAARAGGAPVATFNLTKGGDTSGGPLVARPDVDPFAEDAKVRPTQPLAETLPNITGDGSAKKK